MKQVILREGAAIIEEVPAPQVEAGMILVQVKNSCISIGTELSGLAMSGEPLWRRALKQPENLKKVLDLCSTAGLSRAKSLVQGKLTAGAVTGYSAAGIVVAVGQAVSFVQPGDRIACAGAQYAHHAEMICVPANLCVPVPDTLHFEQASTVTLGAIALQGVRRLQPTLGETFVVLGMGLLGQLTGQILRANGCRVIGMDLEKSRLELARSLSADMTVGVDESNPADQVFRLTQGIGADGVIITAASDSSKLLSVAFNMCRKKARVILVGDVGLDIKRADIYAKELDFLISCSYGPGRYDTGYEELGLDYPVGFVRWTENRNMAEYLNMLAEKKIQVEPLIEKIFPILEAPQAYQLIHESDPKPLMVLLSYPDSSPKRSTVFLQPATAEYSANGFLFRSCASAKPIVRLALIGAGGFAKGMHLPNLQKLSSLYQLRAVVSRSGANAVATAKQFNAHYASTDYEQILADPEIDAVLIATRHHLHAELALKALQANKQVLVEKPLCLTVQELEKFKQFYSMNNQSSLPVLLVGFNRRFSPFISTIFDLIRRRSHPMMINYRLNAGYMQADHWVQDPVQGGGRNIGEACHIYDLFTYLTQSQVTAVNAYPIGCKSNYYLKSDNFNVSFQFADGSVANLTYTAMGCKNFPKEQMEIFVEGKVFQLNDYKSLDFTGIKQKSLRAKFPDKGQYAELMAFAQCVLEGGEWPIPLWQIFQATEMSFEVERQLR